MEFNISSNIREFERKLIRLQRQQVPFALSKAMNNTMFDVRRFEVGVTYPKAFAVKSPSFFRAIMRVDEATKINLVARLTDKSPGGRDYLQRHTEGGTKTPRGSNIAIPAQVRRRARGGVLNSKRPNKLLSDPKVFKGMIRGKPAIMRRMGRAKSRSIKVLYLLRPSVPIKKSFRFYEDGAKVVQRTLPGHFQTSFTRALATAR